MQRKLFLTFPESLTGEPIIYILSRDFGVVPNIHGASITSEQRLMAVVLDGEEDKVDAAVAYLRERGVKVEITPTAMDIDENS